MQGMFTRSRLLRRSVHTDVRKRRVPQPTLVWMETVLPLKCSVQDRTWIQPTMGQTVSENTASGAYRWVCSRTGYLRIQWFIFQFIWVYHEKHHSPPKRNIVLSMKISFFPKEKIGVFFPLWKHHFCPMKRGRLVSGWAYHPPGPIEPRPGCTQLQSDLVEWLGRMALRQRIDKDDFLIVSWLIQRISSRENLQETMGFPIRYLVFLQFSP